MSRSWRRTRREAYASRLTTGALRALSGNGSVALVDFDDPELAELLSPSVSVVAYDAAELGRRAAHVLWERLSDEDRPPPRLVLLTTLVPRGSAEIAA